MFATDFFKHPLIVLLELLVFAMIVLIIRVVIDAIKEKRAFNATFNDAVHVTEYMAEKYANRTDKNNMFGVGISDAEFRAFAIEYLLGPHWYVTDPLSKDQINEIALHEILESNSKQYRKERAKVKPENRRRFL